MIWWAVALGAAFGAPSRYLLDAAVSARFGSRLPWGTVTVNLLGSAAAGLFAGVAVQAEPGATVVSLLAVGFLGAFTTASTFAFEVVALAEGGARRLAVLTVVLSVAGGVALAFAGVRLAMAL